MEIQKILQCKCPNCLKGEMFEKSSFSAFWKIPVMHQHCPNCGYKFIRETGFFYGAMYISYGLTVAQAMALFLITYIWFKFSVLFSFVLIIVMAFLLSKWNFKRARAIWLAIFYTY
ncbi:DUF983 domain-containing protein [Zhouia sp. PK063]|uniref:DUF983 domain-containing protein n=1 Tax=Zhouia sp. PK063 TaxID=3373602 RepID=UPI00378CF3D2